MSYLNDNNFVVWSASVEDCEYSLPLYAGDVLQIFGNWALDSTVDPTSGLKIGLWSANLGIYLRDIVTLNLITSHATLSANQYKWYTDEWTVPNIADKENFRFVLYYDPSDIRYYSNSFREVANTNYTVKVKYRNSNNTLGYLYETATTFYNQFRVDCWTGRAVYNENVSGYDTYEGGFIQVKSDVQKSRQFQTRYFDEIAHEAWFSMLAHSDKFIDTIGYTKRQDQSYEIEWSEFDDNKIGNGIVILLVDNYSEAVINCN